MAYIKERGNNNYFVRVSYGTLDNGRPFQKSRLFHPSRIDLPKTKLHKELDAFVEMLEEECRLEYESRYGIRQMAIPQALCNILQELKKEQDRKKSLLGDKWHDEGFLFTSSG